MEEKSVKWNINGENKKLKFEDFWMCEIVFKKIEYIFKNEPNFFYNMVEKWT